jgi:hypothetical protein
LRAPPSTEIDLTGSNALAVVVEARRILNSRNVPLADRTLALGSSLAADFLNLPAVRAVDQSGSDGALREATIQHYNPIQLEDQSVVDTFYGAKTLDATRAVGITKATS